MNFEMIDNADRLTIVIKRKANSFILILTGLWSVGFYIILATITFGIVTDPDKIDAGFIIFISSFTLFALLIIKTFFWHLRGKEKIELDKEFLIIKKLGTFLTFDRKHEVIEIDSFRVTEGNSIPIFLKLYGFSGGKIEFEYYGNKKRFGQTLEKHEALEIVELLNAKLAQSISNQQYI